MSPTGTAARETLRPSRSPRPALNRGLFAVLGAIVAVALVRGVAGVLVGSLDAYPPLAWPALVGATIVTGTAATLVYVVLQQVVEAPERWFLAIAVVVLALSFVPLLTVAPTLPGATAGLVVTLGVMHVAVAVVVAATLTYRAAAERDDVAVEESV
ncbi:DUF6069 family protein [Halomarina litorea]|uniref:DUF6069 family protein n=1 Tax=Halomarina litorea TaxID=2961595 RepID=UPI0020C46F18|nr:DUF6069 family protein [Halomarina sp. BCD28]